MGIRFDGGLTCAMGVRDLENSIAWYREILGFDLLYRMEGEAWCELKTSVDRVGLGLSEVEEAGGKGGATLTFGVEDIEAAKAELDSKGVRQDGPIRDIPGLVRLVTFYDPDDNALMLYQDLQAVSG